MDVLLILKAVEFVFTFLVLMLLVLWPTHLCSQVSDVDLEAAYSNDAQCALEIQEHIELVKNDTRISFWTEYDSINKKNITVRNERNELMFRRERPNFMCAILSIKSKFDDEIGYSYLIVPVIACSVVLISVAVHLFGIALNKCHTHQLYLFVALIGWLIVALALFIIGIKWDESAKIFKMHFGASFPDLWRACDIIAWIYACVNVAQICLIAFYSKLSIRLEKPSTRVTLVLNKSVFDVDEPAYPLNEDWANRSSNKHLWM